MEDPASRGKIKVIPGWFIDQVTFMEKLMQADQLRARILLWAKEEAHMKNIPAQAIPIFERILFQGEIARGEIPSMLNITERQARRITARLIELGALTSYSPKAPIKLAFPAKLAFRWLPGLFPSE